MTILGITFQVNLFQSVYSSYTGILDLIVGKVLLDYSRIWCKEDLQ